jgi:hypothetical protein
MGTISPIALEAKSEKHASRTIIQPFEEFDKLTDNIQ